MEQKRRVLKAAGFGLAALVIGTGSYVGGRVSQTGKPVGQVLREICFGAELGETEVEKLIKQHFDALVGYAKEDNAKKFEEGFFPYNELNSREKKALPAGIYQLALNVQWNDFKELDDYTVTAKRLAESPKVDGKSLFTDHADQLWIVKYETTSKRRRKSEDYFALVGVDDAKDVKFLFK